jgi:cytochrome c oxidase cbb3-type subunit IV
MRAILSVPNLISDFVTTFWTPIFVGIFLVIVIYALLPRNRSVFDEASKIPLREE